MKTVEMKRPTMKVLNELVIDEAKKLRKQATPNELGSLSFGALLPNNVNLCIYGQMTGDCFSDRATTLIQNSCKKVLRYDTRNDDEWSAIRGVLGVNPKKEIRGNYWSPIEVFISYPRNKNNGNNKKLINFLKDKTIKELKLK